MRGTTGGWQCGKCEAYESSDGKLLSQGRDIDSLPSVNFISTFDWQAFRAEAAKAAMHAMISAGSDRVYPDPDEVSQMAVLYANKLIGELKDETQG